MADIKIKITSSNNGELDLEYENINVLSWTTTTTCTSDASSTIFDVFPNSGQIVLKDIDLLLYKNAIKGAFDSEYNFEVDISVDEEKIAHHIVNQQPYYNYEDKTLTLNLGNELDITNDLVYEGYEYPLEKRPLQEIFSDILHNMLSVSYDDIRDILNKDYDYYLSFARYFVSLEIEYPYLSSKPQREILKNILTLAKCCMYQDENKKLVLVRMDGGFEQSVDFDKELPSTLYDNVNYVLPNQINKGFVPSIIQKNNYNIAEISCNRVDQKTNNGAYYKKEGIIPSDKIVYGSSKEVYIDAEGLTTYYIDGDKVFTRTGFVTEYLTGKFLTSEEKLFATFAITVSLFQKNNLIKVLEPIDKNNILFSLTKGKITTKTTTGRLYLVEKIIDGVSEIVAYSYSPSSSPTTTETIVPAFSQPKIIKYKDLNLSFNISEETNNITFLNDNEFINDTKKYVGCKYKYFNFENAEVNTPEGNKTYFWLDNVTCEEITLEPLSASFSFNGDYTEIEFSGETLVTPDPSTVSYPNKMVIANGGGLMQHTGDITETSFPVQYGLDLLGWYNGGIKTGQLTVIKDQYTNAKDEEVIVGSENHKIFKVGDLIVPCKDYDYTPIMTTNPDDTAIIYKVVEATTYGEGGAVFQDLKVRQVKPKKAQELPYYLVANDTGITICIRENGYATEGSNNQIIQIAWQT